MTFLDLRVPAIDDYNGALCSSPDPHWSLDSLAAELCSIEAEILATSPFPAELKIGALASLPRHPPPSPPAPPPPPPDEDRNERPGGAIALRAFVMRAPVDDGDESTSDSSSEGNISGAMARPGTRFSCTDLYLSDSSDEELEMENSHGLLMRKAGVDEGLLLELERERQLKVKEEVRKRLSKLEALLTSEFENSATAILQIKKLVDARQGMDRQLDDQYQKEIAKELDRHLAVIQRNHVQRSQAEEMRIRNDAAVEEARRKEKALQEEKIRQEKEKAEVEATRMAEEAQKAALDAQIRDLQEAANKNTEGSGELTCNAVNADVELDKHVSTLPELNVGLNKTAGPKGIKVKVASSAVLAEERRVALHKELVERNAQWVASKEFENCDRQISRRLRQISGTVDNVRSKASELTRIIKDPQYPYPLSLLLFAKKVVGLCENPDNRFQSTAFACGYVILLLASQVPGLVDIVVSELHGVCIYTVPKHIQATEPIARTRDYLRMIGYREENGKMETSEKYRERIEAYMGLYGAIVQAEFQGIENPLGLKEGWAWLARFLNELPATAATATALHAFLKMAGYALCRKYKSQFRKVMAVISDSFLPALRARKDPIYGEIISKLELFIDKKEYFNEPEGWRLRTHLSSKELF